MVLILVERILKIPIPSLCDVCEFTELKIVKIKSKVISQLTVQNMKDSERSSQQRIKIL